MKRTLISCVAMALMSGLAFAGNITQDVRSGDIWTKNRNQLANSGFNGVRYAPIDDNSFRVPRNGGLQLDGIELGETIVTWNAEGVLSNMVAMLYNKGDDGSMNQVEYTKLLQSAIKALNTLTGVEGKPRRSSQREAGVALKVWVWEWDGGVIRLEASYSGGARRAAFEAEFIRLRMGATQEAVTAGGASNAANRRELRTNVKRDEESGDVWIDGVNMVDQGDKGYCVPATVARVFAYYGMDSVDQHALAQLCDSSGQGGTSTAAMQTALESISRRFHVRIQSLDGRTATESITALIEDYNKAARRLRRPMATPQNWIEVTRDREVLLAARGSKRAVRRWFNAMKKSIDAGIPVLWSVELGIFPEAGIPQASGGHMRMIIGYNEESETIYYSDSWGAGHERKSMPMNQASAITRNRYILRPSR